MAEGVDLQSVVILVAVDNDEDCRGFGISIKSDWEDWLNNKIETHINDGFELLMKGSIVMPYCDNWPEVMAIVNENGLRIDDVVPVLAY